MNIMGGGVYSKRGVHHVPEKWGFCMILFVLMMGGLTRYHVYNNLPKALSKSNSLQNPNTFIGERAWNDLYVLSTIGPKTTGSYNNEVLAVEFLKREISKIKSVSDPNQFLEIDAQIVSGSYWNENREYGMISMYRDTQNIVVKLHGESQYGKNVSVLLNCHFDTVPESPGASDDGVNCSVLLEILRVLSQQNKRLTYNVIFLFNGAEETGLQASHGFITQHKWANEIIVFINLESVGSGGKEILFQATPKSSWLIELYRKVVPYPSAQAAAEEIFTSGLIPSDTDFRIFRDYGSISGLDFAHYINGYRYHTKYDHIKYLSPDVLQHTGENILEMTRAIAANVSKMDFKEKQMVFFDIFGWVLIAYDIHTGIILNSIVIVTCVTIPYYMFKKSLIGLHKKYILFEICMGILVNFVSLIVSSGLCFALAYDLNISERSMFWYHNTFLSILLYCLLSVFVQCLTHKIFTFNKESPFSIGLQTQLRIIGTSYFWSVLTFILTLFGYRLSYTVSLPLAVTTISNILIGVFNYQNTSRYWLYVYLIGQVLVLGWTSNLFNMIMAVLIPTAGRSGGMNNPEIIISLISNTLTFVCVSFLTPLTILLRKTKLFFGFLFAVLLFTRSLFLPFTNIGFPYSDDESGYPTVQRHQITHTKRTLYDKDGNIRYTDSGFWFITWDKNAHKTIESLTMPEEPIPQKRNILCKNEMFCGLPLYNIRHIEAGGFWLPAPSPIIKETAYFHLINHTKVSLRNHRFIFKIKSKTFTSLHIRMKTNVSLEKWNLSDKIPDKFIYNNESVFIVFISYGLYSKEFDIVFDLKTKDDNHYKSLFDISVVTVKCENYKDHTITFSNILRKLPKWAFAIPCIASFKSWTF